MPKRIEKPADGWQCHICDKVLRDIDALRQHVRLVHAEKRKCEICDSSITQAQWKYHVKTDNHLVNEVLRDTMLAEQEVLRDTVGTTEETGHQIDMQKVNGYFAMLAEQGVLEHMTLTHKWPDSDPGVDPTIIVDDVLDGFYKSCELKDWRSLAMPRASTLSAMSHQHLQSMTTALFSGIPRSGSLDSTSKPSKRWAEWAYSDAAQDLVDGSPGHSHVVDDSPRSKRPKREKFGPDSARRFLEKRARFCKVMGWASVGQFDTARFDTWVMSTSKRDPRAVLFSCMSGGDLLGSDLETAKFWVRRIRGDGLSACPPLDLAFVDAIQAVQREHLPHLSESQIERIMVQPLDIMVNERHGSASYDVPKSEAMWNTFKLEVEKQVEKHQHQTLRITTSVKVEKHQAQTYITDNELTRRLRMYVSVMGSAVRGSRWTDEEYASVAGFLLEADIDPRQQTPSYDWCHDVAGHLGRGAGAIESLFGTKSEYSKNKILALMDSLRASSSISRKRALPKDLGDEEQGSTRLRK